MDSAWTERLSAYLDGEMSGAERQLLEEELERNPALRAQVEDLRRIITTARRLPEREPRPDLWRKIEVSLDAAAPGGRFRRRRSAGPWRWSSIVQLAAGLALLLGAGAGGWLLRGLQLSETGESPSATRVSSSLMDASPTSSSHREQDERIAPSVAASPSEFESMSEAIAALEVELLMRGDALDEETRIVLEDNLYTIDRAIREAQRALDLEPSSDYLHAHLASAMRRKVRLLQDATRLASMEI